MPGTRGTASLKDAKKTRSRSVQSPQTKTKNETLETKIETRTSPRKRGITNESVEGSSPRRKREKHDEPLFQPTSPRRSVSESGFSPRKGKLSKKVSHLTETNKKLEKFPEPEITPTVSSNIRQQSRAKKSAKLTTLNEDATVNSTSTDEEMPTSKRYFGSRRHPTKRVSETNDASSNDERHMSDTQSVDFSPRTPRNRQPSRKLLESKMDEALLAELSGPTRRNKGRATGGSRTVSNSSGNNEGKAGNMEQTTVKIERESSVDDTRRSRKPSEQETTSSVAADIDAECSASFPNGVVYDEDVHVTVEESIIVEEIITDDFIVEKEPMVNVEEDYAGPETFSSARTRPMVSSKGRKPASRLRDSKTIHQRQWITPVTATISNQPRIGRGRRDTETTETQLSDHGLLGPSTSTAQFPILRTSGSTESASNEDSHKNSAEEGAQRETVVSQQRKPRRDQEGGLRETNASQTKVPFPAGPSRTRRGEDLPDEHRPREKARPVPGLLQNTPEAFCPSPAPQHRHRGAASRYFDDMDKTIPEEYIPEGEIETTVIVESDMNVVGHQVEVEEAQVVEEETIVDMPPPTVVEAPTDSMEVPKQVHGPCRFPVINSQGHEVLFDLRAGEMYYEHELRHVAENVTEYDETTEIIQEENVETTEEQVPVSAMKEEPDPIPEAGTEQQGPEAQVDESGYPEDQRPHSQTEEDEDAPPRLVPEMSAAENRLVLEPDADGMIRVQSPGGTIHFVSVATREDGTEIIVDQDGNEVQMIPADGDGEDPFNKVEFNLLDSKNVCCGFCGEIVLLEVLASVHLVTMHPEVCQYLASENISVDRWVQEKIYGDAKGLEALMRGYPITDEEFARVRVAVTHRPLRRVSQIRVNTNEMSVAQLEVALRKKMVEKMGRRVPVSLVDKRHARCGVCNAVVSLNKKFEICHLVRHFNAWHPAEHRCAGKWTQKQSTPGLGKPLSIQDFAVIDVSLEGSDNLQCIWCGMFMDRNALAMHFTDLHSEEIEVPKCLLCLQELVINARLLEKFSEHFDVVLPDEHHVKCRKFQQTYNSEAALDKPKHKQVQAISRRVAKLREPNSTALEDDEEEDEPLQENMNVYKNSRMSFGKRSKPKRQFVQPFLRQCAPTNSEYVSVISQCEWKCKKCPLPIYGAVISAAAIRHYKQYHPGELESMQYEICKARLERVSDGCMEFVHPQLVECLICNLTYALHRPYNMCRAVRHIQLKHPEVMPENSGKRADANGWKKNEKERRIPVVQLGETIDDPEMVARFKREYNIEFDKVQTIYGEDGEPVYVLMGAEEDLDEDTAQQLAVTLEDEQEQQRQAAVAAEEERKATGERIVAEEYGEEEDQHMMNSHTQMNEIENGQMMYMDDDKMERMEEEVVYEAVDEYGQPYADGEVVYEEIPLDYEYMEEVTQ